MLSDYKSFITFKRAFLESLNLLERSCRQCNPVLGFGGFALASNQPPNCSPLDIILPQNHHQQNKGVRQLTLAA